jgi:cyanophycinase
MVSPLIPKGKLLLIGGHEEKGATVGENLTVHKRTATTNHFEILGTLISTIPRAHHWIEIIASASAIPAEMEALYVDSFQRQGFSKVGIIQVSSQEDAQNSLFIKRIQASHAVFFTGGDQQRLVSHLADTPLLTAIRNKYFSDPNFIVAGTSAGAMAMPATIIVGGLIHEALFNADLSLGKGLDLIQDVIVDTHFIKRGRFARLAHAVALNPSCLGIGLGEDTAVLVSQGNLLEVIGSGMVILIDPSQIHVEHLDSEMQDPSPIVLENLIVSILAEGCCYHIQDRRSLKKFGPTMLNGKFSS